MKNLSVLIGEMPTESIIEQGYIGNSTTSAGCYIKTTCVHSIADGKVISITQSYPRMLWCVTIEVTSQAWYRYCDLGDVKVDVGDAVTSGQLVGHSQNGLIKFEYCTQQQSQFPVRVANRELYKHDPTPILFN